MVDKLSAILVPVSRRRVSLPSPCAAAVLRGEIPPRETPRALIAVRGDATGLPMDRRKSRALCNPPAFPFLSRPSSPRPVSLLLQPSFNIHPVGPAGGRQAARSFQFARVVRSTGDRKILGEENSFSSASPPHCPASIVLSFLPSSTFRDVQVPRDFPHTA